MNRRRLHLILSRLMATLLVAGAGLQAAPIKKIILDTSSELVQLQVMVRAGSAQDPAGLEGLAHLTGRMLIEGSFGDPAAPVTKEALADIVRPWGEAAYPRVLVEKETTTFTFTIPRKEFATYVAQVLGPMFTGPLFNPDELERLKREIAVYLRSTLRLEHTELLGLYALDGYLHQGTPYGHVPAGTVQGLQAITAGKVGSFYRSWYTTKNATVALSTAEPAIVKQVDQALARMGKGVQAKKLRKVKWVAAPAIRGREMLIISQPTTIATGIHAGFPIAVKRGHPDYWPLYVASVYFGTHRDSFGRLFNQIRELRGYNYGDYAYIEWFEDRPFNLFPPPNTPRKEQYFSLWVRPVAHEYAHHVTKAMTWELENLIRRGLTPEQVAAGKNKAKVLFLNLAETGGRLLAYKLDDAFYRSREGYLDSYLETLEKVTPEQVNAAIRRHLQTDNMKYVIVTNEEWAPRLAEDIARGTTAKGKDLAAYNFDAEERDGELVYQVPPEKTSMIARDVEWEAYPLNIPASRIQVVPSTRLFETRQLLAP